METKWNLTRKGRQLLMNKRKTHTMGDIADDLGVTTKTVYRWMNGGSVRNTSHRKALVSSLGAEAIEHTQ